ncbi:TonB-dependent receptor [Sandaracinobacter sp. RS1-74]|uniref:TonB-dependent receptor n=1 Tax=Sandaracinobacteroides sayramensis TaxID=2913411 RepID=UPI001EDA8FE3|nr:TonB-dependent receptor [Sandaracinobacteroides sayramensis]MCG2841904.1 TonB-dependent receptor [Sandaracinobacteroides sayramensis]
MRSVLLASVALCVALPAFAQEADTPPADNGYDAGDIIVTATKRAQALSDVPIAVSAITAESLQNSGATDIRQLNQVSPSLMVSSSSSEAGGGVARIRGIGTVGDNIGLESSVAVFIDGVYRSRSGAGLTELGAIERIEVLRGPQGTLFGRNASAGLINIVTAKPKFETGGSAEVTYGNYDYWRLVGGITGPLVEDKLAYRLDGVFTKRDGFLEDVISGRKVNNRDRWLLRGQLLFTPNDDLEIRLTGDFTKRNEECCSNTYLPFQMATRDAQGNVNITANNPIVSIIRGLGGVLSDDTFGRKTSMTPGRSQRSDVRDWGLSAEVNWSLGFADLSSITAYRDWKLDSAQDADFNNLDILARDHQERQFRTFSQELRLNGRAFDDRLDWLVGGYFAHEKLDMVDDLRFGADATRYANCLVANSLSATASSIGINGLLSPGSNGCVNGAVAAAIVSNPLIPAALKTPVALWSGMAVPGLYGYDAVAVAVGRPGDTINGRGIVADTFNQTSRNFAIFTHNVFDIVPDRLQLTLGGRYTNERKTLDAELIGNNTLCAAIASNPNFAGLAAAPCAINPIGNFKDRSVKKEDEWTGTAVLSWKPIDELMTYASYSLGYKAGGFNLDRAAMDAAAPSLEQLKFEPETVTSMEIGAKLDLRSFQLNVAAFRAVYDQFQLNTFNGTSFVVENIQSCRDDLNGADMDASATTGSCDPDRVRGGVTSTGVEVESLFFPARNVTMNVGFTYADTKYRENLVGAGGRPLAPTLANIPGQQMSNAPKLVHTAAVTWTPPINDNLGALVYVDYRLQSEINTGSDLFPEKRQDSVFLVNARLGLNGNDRRWQIEAWAQNLLNVQYQQVVFNAPLQGSGSIAQTAQNGTPATTLFGSFLAEPRTFGVTVRTKF